MARASQGGPREASDYAPRVPAPPPLRGPGERDAYLWAIAVGLAAGATAVAWAAGARLGAALTYGVIVLVAVVNAGLWLEGRPRRKRARDRKQGSPEEARRPPLRSGRPPKRGRRR